MPGQRIDNAANLQVKESLSYKTATTTSANGPAVDTKGWKSITGHLDTGTITDGTHTLTIEESDVVGSGYTALAAADDVRNLFYGEMEGIVIDVMNQGTIPDPDGGTDINLLTQDYIALRIFVFIEVKVLYGNAFALLKTAAS